MRKENITFGTPYSVLNLSKIGLRYFRVGINASNKSKDKIIDYLFNHPNVGWIFYAKGYFNLAIGVWAKDNAEINDISRQIRNILSEKDEIVFQSELTSLYSFGNRPATGSGDPMCIVDATTNQVELLPLEIDYIKLLTLDNSMSESEFSEILNIDIQKLKEIDKKLKDSGIIVGNQERIDYSGIYFKVFVDSLSRKTKNAEDDLVDILWNDRSCIYFGRANSKYDLEFEVILNKKSDLKKYLKNFKDHKSAVLTKNVYTNLYPVNKVANLKEIRDTLLKQNGEIFDFRNSKLWYLNYSGAEAYLSVYDNKKYYEIMEKGELDLFKDIALHLKNNNPDSIFNLIDIGSGDGIKARYFIDNIGEKLIKSYYPVDIQPIELKVALKTHESSKYAKHPTLLNIENLAVRFPLKTNPNEKNISVFFGGTYGNFKNEQINQYLKPMTSDNNSILLISMPIITNFIDKKIIESYATNKSYEDTAFGPLLQAGFNKEDFIKNTQFKDFYVHVVVEDNNVVSFFELKNDINVLGKNFKKGTKFKMTTSWKPTLEEFKSALSNDFQIDKIFNNKDMAIAVITGNK